MIEIPQALHEDLVLLRHARRIHKSVGNIVATRCSVEIEEDIVENGEFVVSGHVGVADLLV